MKSSEESDRQVTHVVVKAPEFIDTNPAAYFSIFEAQFMLKNITSSATKFYNVIAALPPEVVGKLPKTVTSSADFGVLKDSVA